MSHLLSKGALSFCLVIFASAGTADGRPAVGPGLDIDIGSYSLTTTASDLNDDLCQSISALCSSTSDTTTGGDTTGTTAETGDKDRPSIGPGTDYDIDIGSFGIDSTATDLNTALCNQIPAACGASSGESGDSAAVMSQLSDKVVIGIKSAQVNSAYYDVLLQATTDEDGALVFQLLSSTAVTEPGAVGALFDPQTGEAVIPELEVDQSTLYSMELELIPGSDPLTFRVVSSSEL